MGSEEPIYTPFFGSMGATAAMAFSGKKPATCHFHSEKNRL